MTLFIFRVEKLTGLPREIVEGAESLQVSLSQKEKQSTSNRLCNDFSLFLNKKLHFLSF